MPVVPWPVSRWPVGSLFDEKTLEQNEEGGKALWHG